MDVVRFRRQIHELFLVFRDRAEGRADKGAGLRVTEITAGRYPFFMRVSIPSYA